jgi:Rox3 mediator complex subunit
LYSLTPLANAVARFDPVTGMKNTMRKSYQGHIKDLPGKNVIKSDTLIRDILRVPESEADTYVGPRNIRRLDRETLEGFGVMPGIIPDVRFTLREGVDSSLIRVCLDWTMIWRMGMRYTAQTTTIP